MGSIVVLDLDETLIHVKNRKDCGTYDDHTWNLICEHVTNRCRDSQIYSFYTNTSFFFVRPFAVQALQYLRSKFDFIVIFTAGNIAHASYIQKMLFQQLASVQVDFVFHRENCGKFESFVDKKTLTPYQKNLSHIREIVENSATNDQKYNIDWDDCLFIDDHSLNAVTNCGETLLIPKFDYPCLLSLLTEIAQEGQKHEINIEEAAKDDMLSKLVDFVKKKITMEIKVSWHMIDKRFAMFF